jgi:hypothetical protein
LAKDPLFIVRRYVEMGEYPKCAFHLAEKRSINDVNPDLKHAR